MKWDGAPAIFAGVDPSDGKFFVAKKGIFNKDPKVYKTKADVDADTSGDLNTKMNAALEELPKLGIKGVIQGDFLFGPGDLAKKKIDGTSYVTFHPNTIVYAVPADQARDLLKAKIGIVWHTTYTGDAFENMKASYGVNVKALRSSSSVWSQDAMMTDAMDATMTPAETKMVDSHLKTAGALFRKVAGSTLRQLEQNQQLAQLIEQFNNTYVRKGEVIKIVGDILLHYNDGSLRSSRQRRRRDLPCKVRKHSKRSWMHYCPSSTRGTQQVSSPCSTYRRV